MPTDIGGIPLHPLVVHVAVVLVPLSALGVFVLAVMPRWRRDYAGLVLAVTVAAVAVVPVATRTGSELESALGAADLVGRHSQLGERMIWFALPLLAGAVALWWLGGRRRAGRVVGTAPDIVLSVLAAAAAVAATAQMVLVGHSGASAVWAGTPTGAPSVDAPSVVVAGVRSLTPPP